MRPIWRLEPREGRTAARPGRAEGPEVCLALARTSCPPIRFDTSRAGDDNGEPALIGFSWTQCRFLTRMKTAAQLCNDEWESLAERDSSTYPNDLSAIVVQAFTSPRLRALFPFLSMGRLCLSQCTEYPFYVPLWFHPIGNDVFAVMRPENPRGWVDGVEVQRGSATDVVHHVEQALARDECPVQIGNAETLGLG